VSLLQDTSSVAARTSRAVFALLPDGSDPAQPHVHCVGLGQDTDSDVLDAISQRTNGRYYATDALGMADAFQHIATEF
jgi:hypothetical protein